MLLNSLNRDMFKPFRSHSGLLSWVFGCLFEDFAQPREYASMRALWSDRPNCSHVSKSYAYQALFLIKMNDLQGKKLPQEMLWEAGTFGEFGLKQPKSSCHNQPKQPKFIQLPRCKSAKIHQILPDFRQNSPKIHRICQVSAKIHQISQISVQKKAPTLNA